MCLCRSLTNSCLSSTSVCFSPFMLSDCLDHLYKQLEKNRLLSNELRIAMDNDAWTIAYCCCYSSFVLKCKWPQTFVWCCDNNSGYRGSDRIYNNNWANIAYEAQSAHIKINVCIREMKCVFILSKACPHFR